MGKGGDWLPTSATPSHPSPLLLPSDESEEPIGKGRVCVEADIRQSSVEGTVDLVSVALDES